MQKKIKYDMKSVKESLLMRAGEAFYALGRINNENTIYEEELIAHALYKVLDDDIGTEEQFLELRGLSYMLQGIAQNLRHMEDISIITEEQKETFETVYGGKRNDNEYSF